MNEENFHYWVVFILACIAAMGVILLLGLPDQFDRIIEALEALK